VARSGTQQHENVLLVEHRVTHELEIEYRHY
jgi:hypothetical protein